MATNIETPKQVERLDELIDQLQLEGCLAAPKMQELEQILLADPTAQEWYCRKQELHSVLAVDNAIRLELAKDLLPGKIAQKPVNKEPKLSRLEQVNQNHEKNAKQHYYRMATSIIAMLVGVFGLIWLLSISQKVTKAMAANNAKPTPATVETISYATQILPIFADNCLSCHGEDEGKREADLRLDVEASTIDSDEPVIIRGNPEKSALVARIQSDDEDYQMPPRGEGQRLSANQEQLIIKWIKQGAPY